MVTKRNESGTVTVAREVFTILTGEAAINCLGVKGMTVTSVTDGLVHLLRRESMGKGVKVIDNGDDTVSGILLQHPVPDQVDERACFDAIRPEKDADGVGTFSFGALALGGAGMRCATPLAIMALLERYGVEVRGRNAVVIGRSPILGKPVAMLLLNADATVTVCHSKSLLLADIARRADILVAAVGRPKFVTIDYIKEGAVVIDAGYNPGNIGDVDLEAASRVCSAYTPVPGGVGPMTIAKLLEQTVAAAEKKAGIC